jgi:hypothetical protein
VLQQASLILGTSPTLVSFAEDRERFAALVTRLQPSNLSTALPRRRTGLQKSPRRDRLPSDPASYVLGGRAMDRARSGRTGTLHRRAVVVSGKALCCSRSTWRVELTWTRFAMANRPMLRASCAISKRQAYLGDSACSSALTRRRMMTALRT